MDHRKLEVTLLSAANLPSVRLWGDMKVYAKMSISSNPEEIWITPVDLIGRTHPTWNCNQYFLICERDLHHEAGVTLVIKLFCQRTLGDKPVGEVNISVKHQLFDVATNAGFVTFDVGRSDSSEAFGELTISYNFGPPMLLANKVKVVIADEKTGFLKKLLRAVIKKLIT